MSEAKPAETKPAKKEKEPEPTLLTAEPGQPKQHFNVEVKFPVYSIDWIAEDVAVLAGGGGSSRTGVSNRLSAYKINPSTRQLNLLTLHTLSKTEDAPMSIAVHAPTKSLVAGINSDADKLKEGVNENLRLFNYTDDAITFDKSKQTLNSTDEDHYQKITTFSRSTPTLVAIGSTNSQLSLLSYPSLVEIYPSISYGEKDEIYDADFNDDGTMLMGTSSKKLCIWGTEALKEGEDQKPIQTIERPNLKASATCTFRAAKFGRKVTQNNIYTVVNSAPNSRASKDKKAFVSMWDAKTWKLVKTRVVSQRPLTALDVSPDGTMLAYGSSDLSVGVLDAKNLSSIMTILRAHDFPVTALKFNPSSELVVSGSADNSVRVITVPPASARGAGSMMWNVLLVLLILIIAVTIQMGVAEDVLREARKAVWL